MLVYSLVGMAILPRWAHAAGTACATLAFYLAYLDVCGTTVAKIDRTWALFGVFVAGVVAVVMYPLFGSLSACRP